MNILAFFAHPDDETMACGATLAFAARTSRLTVVCATRGEGGERGDPPLCLREELGTVRSEELRCAVKELGAAEVEFLDYIDPTIGPDNKLYPFSDDDERLALQVVEAIRKARADVLISHGTNGEYGHPAHKLCNRAAHRAIEILGQYAPLFYTVQAAFPGIPKPRFANKDDPAHLILDLEPYRDFKVAAALCHRTQHDLFVRQDSKEAGRQVSVAESIDALESVHRVHPPVPMMTPVQDEFADLLRSSGLACENSEWLSP